MSKFYPPAPPRRADVQAQQIARLDALVTAMEDALRDSNELLSAFWLEIEDKEQRVRIMARRDDNIELRGMVRFYLGEGRIL